MRLLPHDHVRRERRSTVNRIMFARNDRWFAIPTCTILNSAYHAYYRYFYLSNLSGSLPVLVMTSFGHSVYRNVRNIAHRREFNACPEKVRHSLVCFSESFLHLHKRL